MDAQLFQLLYENAPTVGATAAAVVVTLGVLGRVFGFTAIGDKSKLVDDRKLDSIDEQLGEIKSRLGAVEHDVTSRATREEVHRLELSFTRMEGRFDSVSATTQATANAVSRIEEYMYAAAMKSKGGN